MKLMCVKPLIEKFIMYLVGMYLYLSFGGCITKCYKYSIIDGTSAQQYLLLSKNVK